MRAQAALRKASRNSPHRLNRLDGSGRALRCHAGCAALPQWYRPRPQRPRGPAPTAGTAGRPGTSGIPAWLPRSEAKRHPMCRAERTTRDPHHGRRQSHASPYPRGPVPAEEGLHSRYSSGSSPFLMDRRRGFLLSRPGHPTMARKALPGIIASSQLIPRLARIAEFLLPGTAKPHARSSQTCSRRLTCE
jgi:hypothetical protein